MRWHLEDTDDEHRSGGRRLHQISVEVKSREILHRNQLLLPSEALAELITTIRADLRADRQVWSKKLHKWGESPVPAIQDDDSYRTFRPILVLGATGTGKQWIAELIAKDWAGETLEEEQSRWQSSATKRLVVLNKAHASLDEHLVKWPDTPAGQSRGLLTFSAVSCPDTLLDSELFGVAHETASGVAEKPGAFIMAGTGILLPR